MIYENKIHQWVNENFVLQHIKTKEQKEELVEILIEFQGFMNQ